MTPKEDFIPSINALYSQSRSLSTRQTWRQTHPAMWAWHGYWQQLWCISLLIFKNWLQHLVIIDSCEEECLFYFNILTIWSKPFGKTTYFASTWDVASHLWGWKLVKKKRGFSNSKAVCVTLSGKWQFKKKLLWRKCGCGISHVV